MRTASPDTLPRVLAPTLLEAGLARFALGSIPVERTGVALRRGRYGELSGTAVLCGLAGGLVPTLKPGDVVVPEEIGLPDGTRMRCDPTWVHLLLRAAAELGFDVEAGPLLTAPSIVTGDARAHWAARGYVAADMEAGLLAGQGRRMATIRVILDTPARSLDANWERPRRALARPSLWRELAWLAYSAPRFSLRAARVVRQALEAGGCV